MEGESENFIGYLYNKRHFVFSFDTKRVFAMTAGLGYMSLLGRPHLVADVIALFIHIK
jgi:hypothetical protein